MGPATGEEHPGQGSDTLSWVDPRAAAAAANDFLLELFGDVGSRRHANIRRRRAARVHRCDAGGD